MQGIEVKVLERYNRISEVRVIAGQIDGCSSFCVNQSLFFSALTKSVSFLEVS